MMMEKISLAASIIVIVILIIYTDPSKVVQSLLSLHTKYLLAGFAVAIISLAIKTSKWLVLTKGREKEALEYNASYITLLLPGPMMDAARIGIFKRYDKRASQTIPLIAWERFGDFAAMTLLAISGLSSMMNPVSSALITISTFIFLSLCLYLFFYNKPFQHLITDMLSRFISRKSIDNAIKNGKMELWQIILSISISMAFWLTNILVLQIIFMNYGIGIPFHKTLSLFAVAMLFSSFIPLPAGVGSMEAVFMAFGGMEKHYAVVSLMVFRIITFSIQLVLSAISLFILDKVSQ